MSKTTALHYLTNRFNLIEIMSGRIVDRVSAYTKYYVDLLQIASGRLPIFAPNVIDNELLSFVSSESSQAFPVIVEVPLEALGSRRSPMLSALDRATEGVAGLRGGRVWALEEPIALPEGTAVLFRTETELSEHRPQVNVADDWKLVVRPEAFTVRKDYRASVIPWLRRLPPLLFDGEAAFLRQRVAGGLTLFAASGERAFQEVAVSAVSSDSPEAHLLNVLGEAQSEELTRELSLFRAALSAVTDGSSFALPPPSSILAKFGEAAQTAAETHGESQLGKSLLFYKHVLAAERDFTGFPTAGGSRVLRALLFVLLRPEPSRLAMLDFAALNAEPEVHALAMFLVGYGVGRRKLATDFRSTTLDLLLSRYEAGGLDLKRSRQKGTPLVKGPWRTIFSYHPEDAATKTLPDGRIELTVNKRIIPKYESSPRLADEHVVPLFTDALKE